MSENAISSQPSDVGSSDRSCSRAVYRDGAEVRRRLVDANPADTYSQGKPRRLLGGNRRCGACSDDLSRARSLRCLLWSIPRPVPRALSRPGMDVEDLAALESNPAARPWAWPSPWSFHPILPSRPNWRRRFWPNHDGKEKAPRSFEAGRVFVLLSALARCPKTGTCSRRKPRLCGAGQEDNTVEVHRACHGNARRASEASESRDGLGQTDGAAVGGKVTIADEFTIESRTADAIRVRHLAHGHQFIFTVQEHHGRRRLWAGPVMGNAKARLRPTAFEDAARAFAEGEARRADIID